MKSKTPCTELGDQKWSGQNHKWHKAELSRVELERNTLNVCQTSPSYHLQNIMDYLSLATLFAVNFFKTNYEDAVNHQ